MANRSIYMAIAAASCLLGCGEVAPLGDGVLDLEWRVSPRGCSDALVEVVEVRATGPQAHVERFPCGSERATLPSVEAGTYRVELLGFDANGVATFESQPTSIDVLADGHVSLGEVELRAAPADLEVRWLFENGRVCGANEANMVNVIAYDELDYRVQAGMFSCDAGSGTLPGLRAGTYLVEVAASADAEITWRGTLEVALDRAEQRVVDVMLSPAE